MRDKIRKRIEAVRRGEVPEEYRKSGPYLIPAAWEIERLGNMSECKSRPNRDGEERPIYSVNNRDGFVPQSEQFEKGSYQDLDKSTYKVVKRGEFAYNPARVNVGSIGRLCEVDEAAVSSLYVCISLDERLDGAFFDCWTKTQDFQREISRNLEGSVREYLFYENFSNIRMPLPPVREQQKIADILAACDRVIELKQKRVEELKQLKKTCLAKMLPREGEDVPELRFPGFTAPWEQRKLDEFVSFFSGLTYSPADIRPAGTLVLRSSNVKDGEVVDADNVYVDPAVVNSENVQDGDIIVVVRNGSRALIGKHAEIKGFRPNTVIGAFMTGIRSEHPSFLNALLNTPHFDKEVEMNMGATINQITGYMFSKMEFMVPSPDEQDAIGEYFKKLDNLITFHQRELEAEQQKKKALMQLLLTGLVRVNT